MTHYHSIPFKISLRTLNSSLDKVTPFPIFPWSGAQSLKSYFGALSFQLIRFNSFVQPLVDSESLPITAISSYLMFYMAIFPFSIIQVHHMSLYCLYQTKPLSHTHLKTFYPLGAGVFTTISSSVPSSVFLTFILVFTGILSSVAPLYLWISWSFHPINKVPLTTVI